MIRIANSDDVTSLAQVSVRTWQKAYRGKLPQEYLDALSVVRNQDSWERRIRESSPPAETIVLDSEQDGVIGFVHVTASRDSDSPTVGEVAAIYVLPDHWGRGVGKSLMEAGLRHLAGAGFRQVTLWVLEGNERARRFYESAGWYPDGALKSDHSRGFPIDELRYRFDQDS